ncbi:MAG: serine/threonine protein kinase [Planctomycetes bacterium]|nr:serine/threonine protein kinase [Planctomycetota bacterium]
MPGSQGQNPSPSSQRIGGVERVGDPTPHPLGSRCPGILVASGDKLLIDEWCAKSLRPGKSLADLKSALEARTKPNVPGTAPCREIIEVTGAHWVVRDAPRAQIRSTRLSFAHVQSVENAARVARAVAELHAAGRVHGNISPETVSLEGPVFLWEAALDALTEEFAEASEDARWFPGKAPELWSGGPGAATQRGDVYSLAALLAAAVLGNDLFGEMADFVAFGWQDWAEQPESKLPGIDLLRQTLGDNDLVRVWLAALEKDPGRRSTSAGEFAEALEQFARQSRAQVAPPPPVQTAPPPTPASQPSVLDDPTLDPEELQGKLVAGYRVEKLLGRGGMGLVYEAEQMKLERRVALKVLLPDLVKRRDLVERFQKEARTVGKFNHRNIAVVYDVGSVGKVHYIAMELVDGVSLDRVIQDRVDQLQLGEKASAVPKHSSLLPFRTHYVRSCIETIASIADALHEAHRRGLIHRDVKPQNILVNSEGVPKLLDFGLVREDQGETLMSSAGFVGTFVYSAPEQVVSKSNVDRRSDIYSLGATLYELLTLKRPFEGTSEKVFEKLQKDAPPPMRTLNASIPPELDALVLKALARERDGRYSNAEHFAVALRDYVRETPEDELERAAPTGAGGDPAATSPPTALRKTAAPSTAKPASSTSGALIRLELPARWPKRVASRILNLRGVIENCPASARDVLVMVGAERPVLAGIQEGKRVDVSIELSEGSNELSFALVDGSRRQLTRPEVVDSTGTPIHDDGGLITLLVERSKAPSAPPAREPEPAMTSPRPQPGSARPRREEKAGPSPALWGGLLIVGILGAGLGGAFALKLPPFSESEQQIRNGGAKPEDGGSSSGTVQRTEPGAGATNPGPNPAGTAGTGTATPPADPEEAALKEKIRSVDQLLSEAAASGDPLQKLEPASAELHDLLTTRSYTKLARVLSTDEQKARWTSLFEGVRKLTGRSDLKDADRARLLPVIERLRKAAGGTEGVGYPLALPEQICGLLVDRAEMLMAMPSPNFEEIGKSLREAADLGVKLEDPEDWTRGLRPKAARLWVESLLARYRAKELTAANADRAREEAQDAMKDPRLALSDLQQADLLLLTARCARERKQQDQALDGLRMAIDKGGASWGRKGEAVATAAASLQGFLGELGDRAASPQAAPAVISRIQGWLPSIVEARLGPEQGWSQQAHADLLYALARAQEAAQQPAAIATYEQALQAAPPTWAQYSECFRKVSQKRFQDLAFTAKGETAGHQASATGLRALFEKLAPQSTGADGAHFLADVQAEIAKHCDAAADVDGALAAREKALSLDTDAAKPWSGAKATSDAFVASLLDTLEASQSQAAKVKYSERAKQLLTPAWAARGVSDHDRGRVHAQLGALHAAAGHEADANAAYSEAIRLLDPARAGSPYKSVLGAWAKLAAREESYRVAKGTDAGWIQQLLDKAEAQADKALTPLEQARLLYRWSVALMAAGKAEEERSALARADEVLKANASARTEDAWLNQRILDRRKELLTTGTTSAFTELKNLYESVKSKSSSDTQLADLGFQIVTHAEFGGADPVPYLTTCLQVSTPSWGNYRLAWGRLVDSRLTPTLDVRANSQQAKLAALDECIAFARGIEEDESSRLSKVYRAKGKILMEPATSPTFDAGVGALKSAFALPGVQPEVKEQIVGDLLGGVRRRARAVGGDLEAVRALRTLLSGADTTVGGLWRELEAAKPSAATTQDFAETLIFLGDLAVRRPANVPDTREIVLGGDRGALALANSSYSHATVVMGKQGLDWVLSSYADGRMNSYRSMAETGAGDRKKKQIGARNEIRTAARGLSLFLGRGWVERTGMPYIAPSSLWRIDDAAPDDLELHVIVQDTKSTPEVTDLYTQTAAIHSVKTADLQRDGKGKRLSDALARVLDSCSLIEKIQIDSTKLRPYKCVSEPGASPRFRIQFDYQGKHLRSGNDVAGSAVLFLDDRSLVWAVGSMRKRDWDSVEFDHYRNELAGAMRWAELSTEFQPVVLEDGRAKFPGYGIELQLPEKDWSVRGIDHAAFGSDEDKSDLLKRDPIGLRLQHPKLGIVFLEVRAEKEASLESYFAQDKGYRDSDNSWDPLDIDIEDETPWMAYRYHNLGNVEDQETPIWTIVAAARRKTGGMLALRAEVVREPGAEEAPKFPADLEGLRKAMVAAIQAFAK